MSAKSKYFEAIQKGLNLGEYHAVWPPGKPVTLGAIGKRVRRVYDPRGHLQDYVAVEPDDPDPQPDGLSYADGKGIGVEFNIKGKTGEITQALANVDLSATISFSAKNQVVLRAVGVRYELVRDTRIFAESVLTAFDRRKVAYGDVFVNGLITATSGAAAVSASADAKIEITGKGDVTPGAFVTLLSLKSGISLGNTTKTSLTVPMTDGFVVAVRLVSLDKKGIFKVRPVVSDVRSRARASGEEGKPDREYEVTFEQWRAVDRKRAE
jgi:hypothetical protein